MWLIWSVIYVQDLSKYVFKLLSCRGNKDIFTIPKYANSVIIVFYKCERSFPNFP